MSDNQNQATLSDIEHDLYRMEAGRIRDSAIKEAMLACKARANAHKARAESEPIVEEAARQEWLKLAAEAIECGIAVGALRDLTAEEV